MTNFMSRNVVLFDGSSAQSSTFTTASVLVADFDNLTVSWQTDTTAASTYTIQGTNVDGFGAAIAEGDWSDVTAITAQGIFTIDPGVRWLRGLRNSNESVSISRLQLRT